MMLLRSPATMANVAARRRATFWMIYMFSSFMALFFCTTSVNADEAALNYQINGSFEYATNPDIPDYWAGTGRFYRSNGMPWELGDAKGLKSFREGFFLDDSTAFLGKRSIRLQRPFFLLGMQMDVVPDMDYIISFYMKAEFNNRQVRVAVTDRDTQVLYKEIVVTVNDKWARYQLFLDDYPHKKLSFFVTPLDSGKLWADAVQIEAGQEATPFIPSSYDKGFTLPQPEAHPEPGSDQIPTLTLGQPTQTPPVIDGMGNDEVWGQHKAVKMNDYMGAPAMVDTQVKITYDATNVYLFLTCADPGDARGLGDSIEIFFDVLGIGDPYYQFIFDTQGTKRNFRSLRGIHEWDWQADWQVVCKMGEGSWTAEVAIPLAALPDTATMAQLNKLRMNVCRNYAPGPEKYLSWAPVQVGFLEPERFGHVILGEKDISIAVPSIGLEVDDATDSKFNLNFSAMGHTDAPQQITAAVSLEEEGQAVQSRTVSFTLQPNQATSVTIPSFRIDSLRSRVTIILTNTEGETLRKLRTFIDVPHPMRLYTEYSYYTTESDARIVVEFNGAQPPPLESQLELTLRIAGYPTVLAKKVYTPETSVGRQIFLIPVGARKAGQIFDVEGRLLDNAGNVLMHAGAKLFKYKPHNPEVKINRINRGIYLNGEPYIPYGIQVPYFDNAQLRNYKNSGFDFISFPSHWHSPEKVVEFLKNCEQVGLNVMAMHLARPGRIAPPEAASLFRNSKSLIAIVPNDEESDRQVYDIADRNKIIYPEVLTWINHNFTSYKAFENRLEGLPGDVLSIDRYPLCMLPKGRPQTISEIYSVERTIEMMDRDGERERMPLFFWLQAGERFSKEPTPQELTWINYILLVNHCVGYTYFAGMPSSQFAWDRMISLNKEVQALKPYLFSFEPEPDIGLNGDDSKAYIRVLPKILDNELLLICINRAMKPIDAEIDLSHITQQISSSATVMFDGGSVTIGKDKIVRDRFEPLARRVYKIRLTPSK